MLNKIKLPWKLIGSSTCDEFNNLSIRVRDLKERKYKKDLNWYTEIENVYHSTKSRQEWSIFTFL